MQRQPFTYAFQEALPIDWPTGGWTRCEIHKVGQIGSITKRLEADMKDLGYPRKDSYAVAVAVREAITNAIQHGHRGDPCRTVMFNYLLDTQEVLLEIADEGFGFDPAAVPNPLVDVQEGRGKRPWGVLLMRIYMSWIRFNKRGNRVVMCKRRSPH